MKENINVIKVKNTFSEDKYENEKASHRLQEIVKFIFNQVLAFIIY